MKVKWEYTFFSITWNNTSRDRKQKIAPKVPYNCHANDYFQKETTTMLFAMYYKYIACILPYIIVIDNYKTAGLFFTRPQR